MSASHRLLSLVVLVAFLGPTVASAIPATQTSERAEDWLSTMAAYYAANPELKTAPGSGWKPYNRVRWEYEAATRGGTGLPDPLARWRAWQETQDRFAAAPPARASWFQLGPENIGGRMLAISFVPGDPSIIYAGSAGGGLWKSTDSGASFVPITDHLMSMAVSGVAVSHTDPDLVVIGTGELPIGLVGGIHSIGILRSTDAGATWLTTSITHTPNEWFGFHVVEAGPNGTFLAGGNDGLWRSSDDGQTWINVLPDFDYYDVKWKPGDPNTVFTIKGNGGNGNNVKISTDDGLTWARAGTGHPFGWLGGKSKIAVTPGNPDYVYALYTNTQGNDTVGLYRTTDGGQTWAARNTTVNVGGQQGWYNLSLACDPNDPDTVIAGGVRLYRSTNGGTTLSQIANGVVHVDHHDARYEPGSDSNIWVACDGGLWKSTNDANGGWVNHNSGLVTFQFYDICVSQSNAGRSAGGSQDNGTPVRTSVNNWDDGMYWMDGMVCQIDPDNGDVIYGEGQFGAIHKSTNGGLSWVDIQNGMPSWEGLWETPIAIDRHNGDHLYTMRSTAGTGIYRTTNGGSSWTHVAPDTPQGLAISPVVSNIVWALPNVAIVSTDDGNTWTDCAPFGFPTGGILRVEAHSTDPQAAFCCFYRYNSDAAIAYTTDLGATWADVSGDLPQMPIRDVLSDPADASTWYAAAEVGVWVTTNGGTNWLPYSVGLPNAVVRDLEIQESSRKLLAGTFGRGAWETDMGTPGVGAPDIDPAPIDLMLDAPAPNPARDSVLLRWASKRKGTSRLVIYDVRGRVVSRLDERDRGDGIIRKAVWFTDDVPSGVYFAVLEAGIDRVSRKIVVID